VDRSRLLTILRFLIGAFLIAFILIRIDILHFFELVRRVRLPGLIPVPLIYLVFAFLSALRWKLLLDYQNFQIGLDTLFKYYLISLLFGQALPTTVGGDIIRVIYLKDRKADAFAVVVMDRLIGFLGLFIFSLSMALIIYLIRREIYFLKFILIGISIILGLIFLLLSHNVFQFISQQVAKIRFLALGERVRKIYYIINKFRKAKKEMLFCLLLSFSIQATLAVGPYLVHRSLRVEPISLGYFLLCVPLINIIAMIPISPGAIGVRETGFVFFFPKFGLSDAAAFTTSLLAKSIEIAVYLIFGGIFYFRRR